MDSRGERRESERRIAPSDGEAAGRDSPTLPFLPLTMTLAGRPKPPEVCCADQLNQSSRPMRTLYYL